MNKFQQHYLEKIRLAGKINAFDGEEAANALEFNQHLYTSFIFNKSLLYLIELRDLEVSINADTLWILAPESSYPALCALFTDLGAQELGCITNERSIGVIDSRDEMSKLMGSWPVVNKGQMIMRIWWD